MFVWMICKILVINSKDIFMCGDLIYLKKKGIKKVKGIKGLKFKNYVM